MLTLPVMRRLCVWEGEREREGGALQDYLVSVHAPFDCSKAWHGMAWHGMAWHGMAWHGTRGDW
jgi:hypothetical protein